VISVPAAVQRAPVQRQGHGGTGVTDDLNRSKYDIMDLPVSQLERSRLPSGPSQLASRQVFSSARLQERRNYHPYSTLFLLIITVT